MKTKAVLTLIEVEAMLTTARDIAQRNQWSVSIAVVDDGGHPLGLLRLEGASPVTAYFASEKARTAALGRKESGQYEMLINDGRLAFLSAPVLNGMLEGGVPIYVDGEVVGAVGVSGVKSSDDVQIARAAIAALNLG